MMRPRLFVYDMHEAAHHAISILFAQNGAHKARSEMLADNVGVLMNLLTIWGKKQ